MQCPICGTDIVINYGNGQDNKYEEIKNGDFGYLYVANFFTDCTEIYDTDVLNHFACDNGHDFYIHKEDAESCRNSAQ